MVGKWIESNYYEAYRVTWYHLIHHPESQKFAHGSKLGAIAIAQHVCSQWSTYEPFTNFITSGCTQWLYGHRLFLWCVWNFQACVTYVCSALQPLEKKHIYWMHWSGFKMFQVFFDIPAGCGDRAWISYSSTDALAGAILGSSLPHRAFFTSRYMGPQK